MKLTKQWKQLTQQYCQKVIYLQAKIVTNLDDWFVKYTVQARSDGMDPGQGRLDPKSGHALFTCDTMSAMENGKKTQSIFVMFCL